jgi:hypothetical protein
LRRQAGRRQAKTEKGECTFLCALLRDVTADEVVKAMQPRVVLGCKPLRQSKLLPIGEKKKAARLWNCAAF